MRRKSKTHLPRTLRLRLDPADPAAPAPARLQLRSVQAGRSSSSAGLQPLETTLRRSRSRLLLDLLGGFLLLPAGGGGARGGGGGDGGVGHVSEGVVEVIVEIVVTFTRSVSSV
jgi:hypothetical protein